MENAGFSHAYRGAGHAQLGGDGGGGLAIDGSPVERTPGVVLELAFHQIEGALVQLGDLLSRLFGQGDFAFGDLLELLAGGGAALGLRLGVAAAEEVQQLVAGDAAQPATKGVSRAVALELRQARHHGLEDVLDNVLRVGAEHALMVAPGADKGRVEVGKASPGVLVSRPQTLQKSQRRRLAGAHAAPRSAPPLTSALSQAEE